ncbi:uncharacterized protein LOC119178825 [Rhipicephalus microplus]|uniref:uncharacterized protein LOC119178825 n=1 Tax=Rhipicephalus microplus TaxID=6941 RepID=UPI003F6B99A4
MSSGAKQKRASIDAAGSSCTATTNGSKRLRRTSACEDEDSRLSSSKAKLPPLPLPPMSKIYNSSYRSNKPAELFRKDLISAMKLPDSEPLDAEDYWFISDGWKQEWERGVQVPVNPGHLPEPTVKVIKKKSKSNDFKLPPNKYLRLSHDEFFSNDLHVLTNVSALAEKTCRYDLDCLDQHWLRIFNEERKSLGLEPLPELAMEMILEDFETQCYDKLQREIRTEQGLGIEYDEDVVCDVCRSPDSEEGNEMVFCDQCDLCVHQACYGIQRIPEGSWVCRTCALGIRPPCMLCPTRGGAMKSTRSGQKWAHVSCALWIPEVSIGCVEKMEPIMKISQIPPSRWALTCCLCRERIGACIQCSVKACKRAYHVTCAFENGLDMKPIIDDNTVDEVKLKSFCPKHSKKKEVHRKEASSDDSDKKASSVSREGHHQRDTDATNEEKESARLAKIQAIEAEFYKHVSMKETAEAMSTDPVIVDFVFNYWKLKRKANHDKPLLTPLKEETDGLDKLGENNLYSRVKMFVHLRQDLERVRNLCYMVSRREKIAKSLLKTREEIFEQQVAMLKPGGPKMSEREREAVILAGQSEHVYDRLVSPDPSGPKPCLRLLLDALEGREVPNLYGLIKKPPSTPTRLPNPYAKQYVNGLRSRRLSMMGGAGESEGCVAQDEDSQGTADSATTVSGKGGVAADQSVRTGYVAAAALETLSEEQLDASEEGDQTANGEKKLNKDVAEIQVRASRSHRLGSVEGSPCTLSKSEIGNEDLRDTESRMSTRSRNADALNEISDIESRISVRSRNFNTVNENSNTEGKISTRSQHADTLNEMNDIEGHVSTRSQTAESVTQNSDIEGKPTHSRKADTVIEMSDTESRTSTQSRNVESANEISDTEGRMSTQSRNADALNEISDTESRISIRSRNFSTVNENSNTEGKMSTRSRHADTLNEMNDIEGRVSTRSQTVESVTQNSDIEGKPAHSRNADTVNEMSDTEGRISTRSRNVESANEISDTEGRMFTRSRNADALNEISDTESRIPVRNRNFSTVNENSKSEGKMSTRSRHADTLNEMNDIEGRVCTRSQTAETVTEKSVIESKPTRSRNADSVNETSDTEGRISTRSRNVESANEISDTEGRISTRSRNADALNEISDTESRIPVRSRNFSTVKENSNTEGKMSTRSRHADTLNEMNDIEGRVCTRSQTAETVTEKSVIEGKPTRSRNADSVNETSDTEGKISTRSRNVESANEISGTEGRIFTRSRNANTVNEISDAEERKSTRSRTAELFDEITDIEVRVSTCSQNTDTVNESSDSEGRISTRSRHAGSVNEVSDAEGRMSTHSRNADSGNEISDAECSMSTQSQNADTVNEVSDTESCMLTRSRNADSGNEISDTECRLPTRSRNVENRNEIGETEGRMATRSRNTDSVNELKREDLSDTESRMSTRNRNVDTVINSIKEEKRADGPIEVEYKVQRRSRRLGSVDSVRSTTKGETRKEDIGIANNRTPTRSRWPETNQSVRSHSSVENKNETSDVGNRTPTRCRKPETSDSVPKGSLRGDIKENEQGEAGSKTQTRSRRCEMSDDGLRSLLKSEMHQTRPVKSECKVSHQSRKHEQKAPLLRSEAKSEESDVGSRSSSRSRRCDAKLEQDQDVLKASKTPKGEADEIRKGECKPSMRSRRPGVRNEAADGGTRSASRQEAKKSDTSEEDCRVSLRCRRTDVLVQGSGDLSKVVLRQEAKKDDKIEQANRKFGRTARLSEARIELVPCDMREFLKSPTDEVETKSGSRSQRLRKQTTTTPNEEDPQPPTLASLWEFPEELNDMGRCTRSSTMQKQEDTRGFEEASSRETAGNTATAASNYGKHTSDENVPKRPDRRERRVSVACSVLLPEALSPPRASSLSGYRIPKKAKAPNGLLEDRRGSSPVSPLHEVPSHCYTGSDGYTRGRSHVVNVRRPVLGHHCEGRGGAYVERWKQGLGFGIPTGNSVVPDWTSKLEVKENGSRYPMRYRPRFGGKDS